MSGGLDVFSAEERNVYERMKVALAVYKVVDKKVVTLLVSDGLCELTGKDRSTLIEHYERDMFGNVHPEDVEMLTQIGNRFSKEEGTYDVTYRTKTRGNNKYRKLHTVGKYQSTAKGERVAFLVYMDVTNQELINLFNMWEVHKEKAIESVNIYQSFDKEREKVEAVLVQTISAISKALDARDPYTCRHSERVAKYASEIARRLNWSEKRIQDIYNVSLVHDIGKIGVSDAVLLKPSVLNEEEYEMIKDHVLVGSNILKDFHGIEGIYEGILYHHERYDGDGYLRGLSGENIPIVARIIGVADSVDAMNSTRPYREKQDKEYIIDELRKGKGKQFDPNLVDIMLHLIEEGILEEKEY